MPSPETLRRVADVAGRGTGSGRGSVGFAFVDDDDMRHHHRRFKGQATITDVLSFSADDPEPPGDSETYWGDVIVCTDEAARQAIDLGHPYPYEILVLALHGVLHLLGYDHTRDDGTMRRLEERLRPLVAADRGISRTGRV